MTIKNNVIKKVFELNQLIEFTSNTWEQVFKIDQSDFYGIHSEETRAIMKALDIIQDRAMLEAEKLRKEITK